MIYFDARCEMWKKGWRDQVWSALETPWDLIIIGGGITGAGILREAARAGLRALLVEQHDFASGTSSRSSKLVHGGFRYLQNAQIKLTLESVRERERLLSEGRGLVNSLGFLMTSYRDDPIPTWVLGAGLAVYDLLALKWGHRYYDAYDLTELCPPLCEDGLQGGYRFFDAQTDDARLVLRVIQEAVQENGVAINYARVAGLLKRRSGDVCGVTLRDESPEGAGRTAEVQASVVVNATGAWADDLRAQVGGRNRLRKLRGSHLIFPLQRLPLGRAVSFVHPKDHRFVFAFPWEGVTLVGTTDVDHQTALETDTAISPQEVEYLLEAAQFAFKEQELSIEDVQATFSGVRPVIDTGKANPSKESREHILWRENGLLTVTGGKLTTFRLMAHATLHKVKKYLQQACHFDPNQRVLDVTPADAMLHPDLSTAARLRLLGRYGAQAPEAVAASEAGELSAINGSPALWAELRWSARSEGVVCLDDLLLRRVRLGLLLPQGGLPWIERIRSIVQPELGWDNLRWEKELANYTNLWKRCYHFPG